jgi:hypothetical protein
VGGIEYLGASFAIGIIAGLSQFEIPTYSYGDDPTEIYRWFYDTIVHGLKEGYWLVFVIFAAVCLIISIVQTGINYTLNAGATHYFVGLSAGNPNLSIGLIFSRMRYFLKLTGATFMVSLFTFLWSLLLFIPGIIASYRYAMVGYILAERPETGIMEAISESKSLMNGRKMRLFCLNFSFIGWILLATLTCGIGTIVLLPYMRCAEATFFLDATGYPLNSASAPNPEVQAIPAPPRPTPPPNWDGKYDQWNDK